MLASLTAIALVAVWLAALAGQPLLPARLDPVSWHMHEMLFGYASAVIAGFLLTAVRNWTGMATWQDGRLGTLVAVWLSARILAWIEPLPLLIWQMLDLAFLPLLIISLARPLWTGNNRNNRYFLLILALMALGNLLWHLQQAGMALSLGRPGMLMLYLVLMVLLIVSGRVLPFFTRNVLPGFSPRTSPWTGVCGFVLLGAASLGELFRIDAPLPLGLIWLAFALCQFYRLSGWFDTRLLRIPVLWVLHAGYSWLGIGGLLSALALWGFFPASGATHALAIGGVGVFTIGMMARVTRGHTGRAIEVSRPTTAAFLILNLATLTRVFAPAILPEQSAMWLQVTGGLWMLAFLLFTLGYMPMLIRPRIDGKPG